MLRRVGFSIALPVVVLGLLNIGLYTQLAPRPPEALANPPHRASLLDVRLSDWFALGGRWQRRDVTLAQENAQLVEESAIVSPLRMAPEDSYRLSATLWLEQTARAAGVSFDAQRPTSHQQSQVVRLGRDESGTYVICEYVDENDVLHVQADERVFGAPDLGEIGLLSVVVAPSSYSVLVGDQVVARDLPRMHHGGWIGL